MNILQGSTLLLALSLSAPAFAQTISTPTYMLLKPLVQNDANGADICGVEGTAAVVINKNLETYEFKFYVSASTLSGHIDAGRLAESGTKKALPRPSGFWIARKDNTGEALHARDLTASRKPGHIAGTADLIPASKQLWNLIGGEEMQISIEYPNQRSQNIIQFSQQLADEDHDALLACMKEQMVSIRREYEAQKKK